MALHTFGPAAKVPPDHGGLLVVDDEPFLRDAVAASLRFLGFEVTTADTGADALRLARDRPFDLVVLDVMLRLARLDQHPARQRDPVDVSALVAGCVERTRIADPGRTWQTRIAPGLVAVGDEELLGRAVDNLLANVQTHTPAGTTAVITACGDGACGDGGRVVVEVSDNGPGVPADRLPRIFDRFYRAGTPANRPGSGLGLAIVTEIAAAHDGTVTAAPGWPDGLRVTLAVPAWREPGSADARAGQVELAEKPA